MLDRTVKKFISAFLVMVLTVTVLPEAVFADETGETGAEEYEYTLDGKTWDELIADFYDSHKLKYGYASFGYYNTVTGETHYHDEDRWFIGASIYKLPLGMLYAEMLKNGELTLEDEVRGTKLETLLYGMIVQSSNIYAERLWKYRGGYQDMRRDFLKYFDMDAETVDDVYWRNNHFTARQMLTCLRHLYEDSETYAHIIDLMLIASPDRNFKSKEQKYEIAHKYGYVPENGVGYYNDTAICYTDDPICIVMLTQGIANPSGVLADFCTLACDYAQSSREQRLEAEEKERLAEQEAKEAEERRLAEEKALEEARLAEEKKLEEARRAEEERLEAEQLAASEAETMLLQKHRRDTILCILCADVLLAAALLIRVKVKKKK